MSMLSRPTFREKSAILDKRRPPVIMKAEKGGDRMKRLFPAGPPGRMQKLTGSSWNTPAAVRPLPCCSIRSGSCLTGARASHTSAPSASTPPSAAARSRPRRPACSTRSRRDCYRRLLPPGRTMPRRAMRSRCAGRTARRSALPAAMTARAFRTAGQSLPPRQIPCCASIRRASCSTRRAQPPRRGRCFTAPWNSNRTARAIPTAPRTERWRPVSL